MIRSQDDANCWPFGSLWHVNICEHLAVRKICNATCQAGVHHNFGLQSTVTDTDQYQLVYGLETKYACEKEKRQVTI